jgi:hypothetical protein
MINRRTKTQWIATVGYVRNELRITKLAIYCEGKYPDGVRCYHNIKMVIPAEWADDVRLVDIAARLKCDKCGTVGQTEVRPDWTEITNQPPSRSVGWIMPSTGKAKSVAQSGSAPRSGQGGL